MDVYLPIQGGNGWPGVLFIHGGGWNSGDKEAHRAAAKRLARSGFVAATTNYRIGDDGRYPRAVQDCHCALAFFRSKSGEYGLDPNRVVLVGYSAGGHLAALLAVAGNVDAHVPDCDAGGTGRPRAVVSTAGRYDLRKGPATTARAFLGGKPEEVPARYDAASPSTYVAPGLPPFLLIHGGGDWVVDEDESRAMHQALLEAGNTSDLLLVEGGGHVINPDPGVGSYDLDTADMSAEAWIALSDFLFRNVGMP